MTATTSLKDQLRRLIELQTMDAEIYAIKVQLKELPESIEALKNEFEGKKTTLKALEDKLKNLQVAQKSLDNDLKSKEEGIAKADASLALLKTNKEYSAKLHEIENLKADKSIVEEKILLSYDEVDALRKAVEAERTVVAAYEKDFTAKKKEVEDAMAVLQDQVKVKETQRNQVVPELRPDVLAKYERILKNKEGLAIVKVDGHTCGGCYMHLTDQLLNQIRLYDQLVSCDMCARIIYLPDEL